jgi:hypothetical protein
MRTKLYRLLWALYIATVGILWFADVVSVPAGILLGLFALMLIVTGVIFRRYSQSPPTKTENTTIPSTPEADARRFTTGFHGRHRHIRRSSGIL